MSASVGNDRRVAAVAHKNHAVNERERRDRRERRELAAEQDLINADRLLP